ncbi:ATP-binding protein [Orrella marina]|uniref:histidine kinase n=1 Tax=Orrella marina TaxID=2163011 RepID=A0A2R4XF19_9BURK|nr:sensor histidine kinase [Orrella marina]AWB32406.1 ATP-binding protein [Orrella marina]
MRTQQERSASKAESKGNPVTLERPRPLIWRSLKARLLAGISIWIVVTVLAAGWTLTDLFRRHITEQLGSQLTLHLNQLAAALAVNLQGDVSLQFEPTDPRLMRPLSGLYWQVDRIAPGQPAVPGVLRSRSLWDEVLLVPSDLRAQSAIVSMTNGASLHALTGPDGSPLLALIQVITPPEGHDRFRLMIATDQSAADEPISSFTQMLSIALGLLALGMTLASAMMLTSGLRPLKEIRTALGRVRSGETTKLEGQHPVELQPLIDEFNLVLSANNKIVERSRAMAGNLAHALKTPLSVMANGARENPSPFGDLVQEQVALANRQVDHHLARARAAAASTAPGAQATVKPVIESLIRVLQKLYRDKPVVIHFDMEQNTKPVFRGDRHDLQEIVGNLLENACKWTDRNVWVQVETTNTTRKNDRAALNPTLTIHVSDDGPGLEPSQLVTIFNRGVRMDEQVPGSGLGLDIVRDLTDSYGGQVDASPSPQGGLCVSVTLPCALSNATVTGPHRD